MRKRAASQAEITLYPSVVTPLGHFFWDPSQTATAFVAGSAAALTGLVLSASLCLGYDSGLGTALFGLATSALLGMAAIVGSLRA